LATAKHGSHRMGSSRHADHGCRAGRLLVVEFVVGVGVGVGNDGVRTRAHHGVLHAALSAHPGGARNLDPIRPGHRRPGRPTRSDRLAHPLPLDHHLRYRRSRIRLRHRTLHTRTFRRAPGDRMGPRHLRVRRSVRSVPLHLLRWQRALSTPGTEAVPRCRLHRVGCRLPGPGRCRRGPPLPARCERRPLGARCRPRHLQTPRAPCEPRPDHLRALAGRSRRPVRGRDGSDLRTFAPSDRCGGRRPGHWLEYPDLGHRDPDRSPFPAVQCPDGVFVGADLP
jgi:hypothetical protein